MSKGLIREVVRGLIRGSKMRTGGRRYEDILQMGRRGEGEGRGRGGVGADRIACRT